MFLSVKLTPARLLAFVTAAVCAFLICDACRTAQTEPPMRLSTDFDRAAYLKAAGLEVDPEPVWSKELRLTDQPDETLQVYLSVLEEQGFDPLSYAGKALTMYAYRSTDNRAVYGRVLMCGEELVGADKILAHPDAEMSQPLNAETAE